MPKVIDIKPINRYYNNLFVNHFGIKKTRVLVAQKHYWLLVYYNIKVYVKGYNVCLISKS